MEASQTKRTHGMPLAFITGIEKSWKWTENLNKLSFDDLHYWGIRDIDPFEKKLLSNKNIKSDHNLDTILKVCEKYDNLHISLDIDAIDPIYTPSTGTPVKNGLELQDIIKFLKIISESKKNISLDIVEYNPLIGNDQERKITLKSINSILYSL